MTDGPAGASPDRSRSLTPPQRAVLSLILTKGKTYTEIAELLQIELAAVRERAHQALDALAPAGGAKPAPRHRAAIGNYLLRQDPDGAPATFAYLQSSVAGRDWARAIAAELTALAADPLPDIPPEPADPPRPAPEPAATPPEPPPLPPEAGPEETPTSPPTPPKLAVSRRGGILLIAGALLLLAGALAALLIPGGRGPHRPAAVARATTPATGPTAPAKLVAQITLKASRGVTARGFAAVIARGGQRVIAIAASGLRPTSTRLAYGAWLYNTPGDAQLIGFVPQVKADGRISAAAPLPAGASRFREFVLTREAGNQVTKPGPIILRGAVPAHAAG